MSNYIENTFTEGPNKNQKKLTVPSVVLVKEGKVVNGHNDTVKSHTNYNKKLTEKQYKELYNIYEGMMTELILCSSDC